MKVLHLSHNVLPDVRIEKEAISLQRNGITSYFAGKDILGLSFPFDPFKKKYKLPFIKMANVGLQPWWNKLKATLKRVIEDCKPDLIHAHNVIAARLAMELNIPFIYDDHEYWSKSTQSRIIAGWKVNVKHIYRWLIWRKWEKKALLKATAVITVSDEIAEEHKQINPNTIVLPNLPTLSEVEKLTKQNINQEKLKSVYIGSLTDPQPPFRNTKGFIEIFRKNDIGDLIVIGDKKLPTKPPIYSLGFLRHDIMMRELTKYHVGIIPWKKHPFHKYCNPNKAYEYAHGGLLLLVTEDLTPVVRTFKSLCITFKDYNELTKILKYYSKNIEEVKKIGLKTMQYAREELVWEKYEYRLLQLYTSVY